MRLKLQDPRDGWVILALLVAVAAVYLQVVNFEFVNYDDTLYVTSCPQTQAGLTWASIRWAFTTGATGNWHPLTWLSHMADVTLYGVNPRMHHLENVLLHAANSVLVFILLRRMTRELWPSALVAALFALHPAHVESVAWVAERKDVLSTLLALLTLYAYLGHLERPSRRAWATMVGLYALALLAKPMVVTLPVLMVLLDYWPLGRAGAEPGLRRLGRLTLEKWPFLVLAAASCVVTFLVQKAGGNVGTLATFPLPTRVANALLSYVRYGGMLFWPVRLAVFYPYPAQHLLYLKGLASGAVLAALTLGALAQRHRRPWLAVGWFWYLISLLPVIGLVQAGAQGLADRYTYLPFLGLFLAVAWSAAEAAERQRRPWAWGSLGAVVVAGCMILTFIQVSYWRTSLTLFGHAARVTTRNLTAHTNLGSAYERLQRYQEAAAEYQEACSIAPWFFRSHYGLARCRQALGQRDRALAAYRKALACKSDDYKSVYMIAQLLVQAGKGPEAVPFYMQFLEMEPLRLVQGDSPAFEKSLSQTTRKTLGALMRAQGQWDDAVFYFLETLGNDPKDLQACLELAQALAHQGRLQEAILVQRQGLAGDPGNVRRHFQLGLTLRQAGLMEEATQAFRQCLALQPGHAAALEQLRTMGRPPRKDPLGHA